MSGLGKLKSNKVLKAGMGYTIGNYLLKGINFLTVPLFTRLMSTNDYGIYGIYMTYDAIFSVFMAFALHSSLKNAKYKYKEEFQAYLSSILLLPIILLLALLVLFNLFSNPLESMMDLNRIVLNILLCHSFANSIVIIYNNKLGLDYKYVDFLKISFINTALNLMVSLALMYTLFNNERYMGRIIGSALPLLIIAIFIYIRLFRNARPTVNLEYWKFGLGYSLPIIPHGISQIILSSFDRIMIKSIVGASEAGIYTLGCNIEGLVKVTTTSLDTVWGPWFYEKMEEKNYKDIKRYSTYYAYGMFVLISCLMLAAPEIVIIMGAEAYRDAKYVVIPLMNCTFFTFLYTLPVTVEYYYQKTKMIAIGTMGAALVNIVLNSICIRSFGYQAAAYTTLAAYIAYFVFHYLIAYRIMGMQLFNTKVIFLLIACVFGINIIGLVLIDAFWLRLIIGIVFLFANIAIFYQKIYLGLRRSKKEET